MIVKLLTEHHLECLSLKGGYRVSSESTHVKMPHCWKSHALAQFFKKLNHVVLEFIYDTYHSDVIVSEIIKRTKYNLIPVHVYPAINCKKRRQQIYEQFP